MLIISDASDEDKSKQEYRMATDTQPTSPIEVFQEWQRCMSTNDQEGTAKVVDLAGYTEICLGLTEWTTGYEAAAANFYRNMVAPKCRTASRTSPNPPRG